jgi:localization factor PodJL
LSNQASFIAAARRAASQNREEPKPTAASRLGDFLTQISGRASEVVAHPIAQTSADDEAKPQKGPFSSLGRAMGAHRRSMLIALTGLIVILGSLQAVRLHRSGDASAPATSALAHQNLAQAPAAPARIVETPAPARPATAPVATIEPAPSLPDAVMAEPVKVAVPGFTPPLQASGFDASPTGATPPETAASKPAQASVQPTAAGGAMLQSPPRLAEAAANGLASAQFEMGVRLADGRGMAQDAQAARQWFEKAARQGLPPAQYRLGAMLERGVGGAKDVKRAQDLYTQAATQGHVRAMHNLGVLNAEGAEGKPDYAAAAAWFRKAADHGLRDSQYNLAILYARGMGVEKNLSASWAWFTAATAQGDADSAQKREEIATRLTPAQLSAAKAMVEAFRMRSPDPAANEVAAPPGGWDALSVTNSPKPAAPAPKAKISTL